MNKQLRKPLAIITARMSSTRLPGKVMMPLAGKPILEHIVTSLKTIDLFDGIVIATSGNPVNGPIRDLAERLGIGCFMGSEDDVLMRHVDILRQSGAQDCVRVCADNPLVDSDTIGRMIDTHLSEGYDYTCIKGFQIQLGLNEVISRHALEVEHREVPQEDLMRRESITLFIRENNGRFKIKGLTPDPFLNQLHYRLTIDYEEDYLMFQRMFDALYQGSSVSYRAALEYLCVHPELARLNAGQMLKQGSLYWQELDSKL